MKYLPFKINDREERGTFIFNLAENGFEFRIYSCPNYDHSAGGARNYFVDLLFPEAALREVEEEDEK